MAQSSEHARKFQDALLSLLRYDRPDFIQEHFGDEDEPEVTSARSYEDKGVLTLDAGGVVRLSDGTEIFITVQAYTH